MTTAAKIIIIFKLVPLDSLGLPLESFPILLKLTIFSLGRSIFNKEPDKQYCNFLFYL